jgi:alpha-glucosidase
LCIDSRAIAKAAAALLLTIRGTPILYYGEEIGMFNHEDIPADQSRDRAIISGEALPSRDGTRTPMQWDDSARGGFSFGKNVQPWLPVNPNYLDINVAKEIEDDQSIFNFYRALLSVRKQSKALSHGNWSTLISYPYEHLAYLRQTDEETVLVLINFSYDKPLTTNQPPPCEKWQVLLSTDFDTGEIIPTPSDLHPFEVSILKAQD